MQTNRIWIYVVLLLGATTLLYGQFLWNPILFDDIGFFVIYRDGTQPVSKYAFSLFGLRSLPYATLAWGKAVFGLDLLHFRIENMLLHLAVVLSQFYLWAYLFDTFNRERADSLLSSRAMAFFAALLFALHPVAVYGAGYLVQRTILMATMFSLMAILAYLHGSARQKPFWLWVSVPFYYLAVFAKEHAIMLPAVLLTLTVLLHDDWRTKLKQRWGIFVALAAIALLVILARKGLLGMAYEIDAPDMLQRINVVEHGYLLSILTQSFLFFKYLMLWLLPNTAWMSGDMRETFASSLQTPYWFALLGFIGYGALAVKLLLKRGRIGLIGFALLFPWLLFMTEFSTVRIQEPFVLYRSYLWMPGLLAIIPLLCMNMRAKPAFAILGLIGVLIIPLTWNRLTTFSHPLLFWDDAMELVKDKPYMPGMERIYYNRGIALSKTKLKQEAIIDYTAAIKLNPKYSYPYHERGSVHLELKQYAEALEDFNTAISLNPKYPLSYLGRARVYEALNDQNRAQENYRKSCELGQRGCEKVINSPMRELQNAR